jgi:hypothetical protein
MIEEYVNKLIENLPNNLKTINKPQKIDIVLDSGAFNGSYLVGALYFLKEMEKRKYIKIERISGSSIGSIVAFLYFIDHLELMSSLYSNVNNNFKEKYNLTIIKNIKHLINDYIPKDICKRVKNRLYICYNDLKKNKKTVKSKFKNVDEIYDSIIKSCYIPVILDGNLLYKNRYIDGMNPYIFEHCSDKKILFLDLLGYDKMFNLFNIKNEKTNYHRVLAGLLDIHNFYIKQSNTQMCSYVNNWSISNRLFYNVKLYIEKIVIYAVCLVVYIKKYIPNEFENTLTYKILSKILNDIFIILLETYCI